MTDSLGKAPVYDSRAYFGQLGEDWRDRLRAVDAYRSVVPREGITLPGRDVVSNLYADALSDWTGLGVKDTPRTQAFYDAFRAYQDRIKSELIQRGAVPIRDRFAGFSAATGLGDYDPAPEYNNPAAFEAAQHEIYAHQIPFEKGFAPDYRDFYAGTDIQGRPAILKANTAFPLNENLAEIGELDIGKAFRGNPLQDPSAYSNIISGRNVDSFELHAGGNKNYFLDPVSKQLLPTRVDLAFPRDYKDTQGRLSEAPEPRNQKLAADLTEAGRLFQQKYVVPAADQMKGLIESQFPGLGASPNKQPVGRGGKVDIMPSRYIRFLQMLDEKYGGSVGDLGNFFYGGDPLGMAASAVPGVLQNIRKVPSSLLPGAADLIPSPEAIRTGYAQGPVEMGKQMAQEFAQSLPTAAGMAMLMSTPAAAPFAPGIGAGMVGTAGARALNEVVRQETGEGIVPKVRQFIGTAPRTGISAPARQGEKPLVAEIKPLTAAQRQQMYKNQTRSEMQRRMDLAKERFNPRRGEFGLSELIFGR